jgi:hypothetical protein
MPVCVSIDDGSGFVLLGVNGDVGSVRALDPRLLSFMMTDNRIPAGVEIRFWGSSSSAFPAPVLLHLIGRSIFDMVGF